MSTVVVVARSARGFTTRHPARSPFPRRDVEYHPSRSRPHPRLPVAQAHADTLARAFHTSADAYPAGTPEATELPEFIPKLASFRARAPPPREPDPARASLARALGIPSHHDPAHKVNARVSVAPPASLSRAVRGRLPPAALDAYARMLPVYEDFHQKRQLAKIVDMAKAKANLPIAAEMDAIVASVRAHPVTLIAGDTGCGKSTQVPQYLIRAGFARAACTQPRRVAAVALARRVAREMLTERGDDVAHQIRFDSTVSRATKCVFLTEGTLLRKLADDPDLVDSHDVVIVDEAHERRADVDLLLGLLRGVLARRPSFRLVIMSATMNLELFARISADVRRRGSRQNVPGGDCVCPTPRAASATDAAVVAKHRSRTRSSRPPAVPRAVTAHRREISPRPTRRPFNFFTRRGGDFLRRRRDSNLREFGSVPPLDRPPAARRSRRDGTGPRVRRRAGRCAKGDPLDQRRRDVRPRWTAFACRRFRTAQGDARRRSRLLGRWNPHGGVDLARVRGSAQRSRGSRRSRRVFPDVLARGGMTRRSRRRRR